MTETSTLTLTDFLLARIAEDEADAQSALERGFGGWEWLADLGMHYEGRTYVDRYHPVRALRECEAKRRIVEDATNMHTSCVELNGVVAILAAVYADHPDYRDEWRP